MLLPATDVAPLCKAHLDTAWSFLPGDKIQWVKPSPLSNDFSAFDVPGRGPTTEELTGDMLFSVPSLGIGQSSLDWPLAETMANGLLLWDWAPVESGRVDDLLWLVSDEVLVQVSARECEAMQWSFEDVVVHVYMSMKGAGAKDACCCWQCACCFTCTCCCLGASSGVGSCVCTTAVVEEGTNVWW